MKVYALLISLLAFCFAPLAQAEEKTITLISDPWCPYSCSESDAHKGFMIDLATQIFAQHGIKVIYVNAPWSRALEMVRSGEATAVVGASIDDAPDFIFPNKPQAMSAMHFFTQPTSSWHYEGITSLKDQIIGSIDDYAYNTELDAYIAQYGNNNERVQQISGENALALNLRKLAKGRITAFVEDYAVVKHYLKVEPADKEHPVVRDAGRITSLEHIDQEFLYLAFSPALPESKRYAQILSDGTQSFYTSPEAVTLMEFYDVDNVSTFTPETNAYVSKKRTHH